MSAFSSEEYDWNSTEDDQWDRWGDRFGTTGDDTPVSFDPEDWYQEEDDTEYWRKLGSYSEYSDLEYSDDGAYGAVSGTRVC